ncbi:MAG: WG repeat-containing protein [Gloeobacteraceae cyanobacterium ES-bin-316]|nr:WG repeat-containing protein [Ferruginibacter sp.]
MKKMILSFTLILALMLQGFAQQIDLSLIPYRQGDKWGYASPDNKVVIAPKYAEAGWFSEGYAAVKSGSKYGYINKQGKLVIPAKFMVAKSFRRGFMPREGKQGGDSILFAGASLRTDGYEICINTKGATMPQCPAISESSVAENNIPVQTVVKEKTYTVPNSAGLFDKIVDDYKMSNSDETYYVALKNSRYGVFNSKFETVVPFEYDSMHVVRTKTPYLEVNKAGMFGVINGLGQMRILPENTKVFSVLAADGKDYVIVKRAGVSYIKDPENNDIMTQGYSDIIYDGKGGFILTGNDNMRGYYYTDRRTVAPKYSDIKVVEGTDYLLVKTFNGKLGYISSAGSEYFVE